VLRSAVSKLELVEGKALASPYPVRL